MKRILFLAVGLALTLTQFSCDVDFDFDDGIGPCVRGNGNNVSRELNLPNFTGIDLDISAEVIIRATRNPTHPKKIVYWWRSRLDECAQLIPNRS